MTDRRRQPTPAKVTSSETTGTPTDLHAVAGRTVGALAEALAEQLPATRMLIGTVVSHEDGPPVSLTVYVNGQNIPNVRYIGTAPIIGADVMLMASQGSYVCLGSLA